MDYYYLVGEQSRRGQVRVRGLGCCSLLMQSFRLSKATDQSILTFSIIIPSPPPIWLFQIFHLLNIRNETLLFPKKMLMIYGKKSLLFPWVFFRWKRCRSFDAGTRRRGDKPAPFCTTEAKWLAAFTCSSSKPISNQDCARRERADTP